MEPEKEYVNRNTIIPSSDLPTFHIANWNIYLSGVSPLINFQVDQTRKEIRKHCVHRVCKQLFGI